MSEAMVQKPTVKQFAAPGKRSAENTFPLSMNQRDMWFQSQIHAQPGLNNVCVQVTLEGALEPELFRSAWQAVVDRHEALRTVFLERDGVPCQKVLDEVHVDFRILDFSEQGAGAQQEGVEQLERELARKQFDFAAGPLLRFALVRLEKLRHVFLFAFSHLILDGIYMSEIFQQVSASYEALLNGGTGALPVMNVQYPDFAAWQNELLGEGLLEENGAYWREQLRLPLPAMELPTDRAKRKIASFDLGVLDSDVPAAIYQRLKSFRKKYRTTLFRAVLAAFEVLLQQLVGEKDLLLGVPFTTLPPGCPELLGFFGHMVPVRASLENMPRFPDVLADVNRQLKDAQKHQDYPLFEAVRGLKISRDPHRPLFPVVISQVRALESEMGVIRMNMARRFVQGGVYHLWLTVRELKDGLSLGFYYNRELLEGRPMALIVDCMQQVLARVAEQPEELLSELELVSQSERERVLRFGDGGAEDPGDSWPEQLIAQRAREHPHALAAVDRDQRLTYVELNTRANRVANWLRSRGAGPEARIGIMGRRSVGMLATILGILKAGAAYVPLAPKDPEDRIRGMMTDAGLSWLAVDGAHVELGLRLSRASGCGIFSWDDGSIDGGADFHEWKLNSAEEPVYSESNGKDLAYIFYTSGSTGVPKGAMVERAGMRNHLLSKLRLLAIGPRDVVVQNASHCFDISVWQFLAPLMAGACVAIYDDDLVLNPASLLEAIKQDRVTLLETVPSYLELLLGIERNENLGSLRYMVSTAESLSVSLSKRWRTRFPGVPLVNAWGPTECSDDVTHEILSLSTDAERVGVGRPIAGSRVYVVDSDMRLLTVGCSGEIAVGGICVGRGYIGDAKKTATTFVPDPFGMRPGARLYLTGDIGRWRWDGVLEFLGRRDGQVKVRGRRIEIAEVEGALGGHTGVRQAAVAVRSGRLVGYWVGNQAIEIRELRKYLSERLPEHMVPEGFVQLEKLPLTRTGKVDRRALPEPDWSQRTEEQVLPRTETEKQIAEVWQEVLGVAQVGVHDDFFEIGGHSLNAARVILTLQSRFGHALSIRQLFLNPTIAQLADELTAAEQTVAEDIPRIPKRQWYSLSPAQKPMWLAFNDLLQTEAPGWGFPQIIRIEGAIEPRTLSYALFNLVKRHEALRVTFAEVEGEPVQAIHEDVEPQMHFHDLSSFQGESQREALRRILEQQLSAPIKNEPPMLRLQLVRMAADVHCLVMQLPHIISDVWTEHILAEELAELYRARIESRDPVLPALTVRYVDYAEWYRKRLDSPELEAQKDYWLETFSRDLEPLDLNQASAGEREARLPRDSMLELPKELMARVRQLANDHGTTLFVILLASLQTLIARLTGATDVAIGTAVSGRTHPALERLAGLFINPIALRSDISGNPTFSELVKRVRQTVLGAFAHQEYPFQGWLDALRRRHGRSDLYPYSLVLLVEEQPKALSFGGARAYFEPMPGYGFDLSRVAGPKLSIRVSEGPKSWYAEVIPGMADTTRVPDGLLARWMHLLEEIVNLPGQSIGDYNMLSREEQHALLRFNRGREMEGRICDLICSFQRSGDHSVMALDERGTVIRMDFSSPSEWQRALSGGRIQALVAEPEVLLRVAEDESAVRQIASHVEQLIVCAPSPSNVEILRTRLGIPVSALVPLDEASEALLWVDEFSSGCQLVGRPTGRASTWVLDQWGHMAPPGVRGRLYKQEQSEESATMIAMPWSGRWRTDGTLEIDARQFETVELDAGELEELLR